MSMNNVATVMKSNSEGQLLGTNEMTINSEQTNVQSLETSRLKRTFTLPRNPFNTTRMSKRKSKARDNANETENKTNNDVEKNNNKKVFRRPSFRKFINKIVQHIGGVPVMNSNHDNRVPPVDLQTWAPDQTPGVTGLRNHGNTCFINAVLQCISHTDILAEYFVLDQYKIDLSRRNKLNSKKYGTKGEVTEQLAMLLKALWACQYSPDLSTNFKQVVERHGSQYKGTQQHDALEFLQWLLDKVHEDLNTASKKKYKSIKTSGRSDEVIAAETLANHIRCNNSFIQAVFQAQYRSSLSCSRCCTQSNTFDPFQCISVQLPQINRHSIYVTVLYTSQQPRQVKIGVNLPSGATITELRDVLQSDTSIARTNMLLTEICETGFLRTFTDAQAIGVISEIDPIYCIEVSQLKDVEDDTTSAYILLCWINVLIKDNSCVRFGSPYTMQVSRETSYEDLQKLMLKEMAVILHDDILTSEQPPGVFKIRISDPACDDNEPPCYLDPKLQHPLFMEAIDQALALCSEEGGPPHVKFVLEWTSESKDAIIADDTDLIEEHSSVKQLKAQALQGGVPLTLEECLRHYTKAETLTLDDAWRCPQCQQYLPVIKTLDVWSLPDILVVHFKRFRQQTLKGRHSTKLTTMVDFPVFGFDMSPHLANRKHSNGHNDILENNVILGGVGWSPWKRQRKQSQVSDNTYDLYGVCYHHGTDLETGHYTAACRNPYDNQWYLFDDTKVTNLSQQTSDISSLLVNNSAYILFYQKRSGVYVTSSSNSSSAASTSSVGSTGDHWVSRMPKFTYTPPKIAKIENKTQASDTINEDSKEKQPTNDTSVQVKEKNYRNSQESVALRNSQTLSNPTNRKSCENKATETTVECSNKTTETKKPIYTTSIYINSSGNVDITTSCDNPSPVLSLHRVIGISENDVTVKLDERDGYYKGDRGYGTLAAVHRFSQSEEHEKSYHSDDEALPVSNWKSPESPQKVNKSDTSMD
ncbi:hypothetical protein RN001_014037 [Aquatica leii]|uniref:Ubiquitin carboxyl-terminal hydrolase n=1 Tax=Aquatica leii TaxID=1421715 RepID=A0AAN7P168_9COLE|nr:hypothetical protein RN001_014037 [Aquatica leii]